MMKLRKYLTVFGWPILVLPFALIFLGAALNELVVYANGLHMPVLIANCQNVIGASPDPIHACMTAHSRLKLLADIFLSNTGVSSLGDVLQGLGDSLRIPSLIVWCVASPYFFFVKKQVSL